MKNFSRQLTYGFEIEGVFTRELVNQLQALQNGKLEIVEKGDGSVNYCSLRDIALTRNVAVIGGYISELNVGIFKSFWEMYHALELFKPNENYFCDSSCGLHIHIGLKKEDMYLEDLVNWKRMKIFQEVFGKNAILKERLKNTYSKAYSPNAFRTEWRNRRKYRCIKNHEAGTLEMRVFSPKLLENEKGIKFIRKAISEIVKVLGEPIIIKHSFNFEMDEVELNLKELNIPSDHEATNIEIDYSYE